MNFIKKTFRWLYRLFWYSFVTLVIFTAIGLSILRIYLPDVEGYREQIEFIASDALGREVSIGSMDARLAGFTPVIIFKDVKLLSSTVKREIVHFSEVQLDLDTYHSIRELDLIPEALTVKGVTISIIRKEDGQILIQGYDVSSIGDQFSLEAPVNEGESDELSQWLFERSELTIEDGTIIWFDALAGDKSIRFENVNLYIKNDGDRHQISANISLPSELGQEFNVALDFYGNILNPLEWQGDFYVDGRVLQLDNWGTKPSFKHIALENGALDIEVWGKWNKGTVSELITQFDARNFIFSIQDKKEPLRISELSGLFVWKQTARGWDLKADKFVLQSGEERWPQTTIDISFSENVSHKTIAFNSSYLKLDDISHLLSGGQWLNENNHLAMESINPQGVLTNTAAMVTFDTDDNLTDYSLNSDFQDLLLHSWDRYPGVDSLSGSVNANIVTGTVSLSDAPFVLDFPSLFREPIQFSRLQGDVNWWTDADHVYISSNALNAETNGTQLYTDLNLVVPPDSSSIHVDLQLFFSEGNLENIKQYYPVEIMGQDLVTWLDYAIVGGEIEQGTLLMNGWSQDFPFKNVEGVFDVQFSTSNLTLQYQQDWPVIDRMKMHGRFSGTSMLLSTEQAMLYDSNVHNVRVEIKDFSNPVLHATANISGYTKDIFRFIVSSPIGPEGKEFYNQVSFSGKSDATMLLQIPLASRLERTTPLHYEGVVTIHKGNFLGLWNGLVDVRDFTGEVHYSTAGVSSKDLTGSVFGGNTHFNLFTKRTGAAPGINLAMQGELSVDEVINKFGPEYKNIANGTTEWQALLSFGYSDDRYNIPTQVAFHSLLEGIEVSLPVPFNKEAVDTASLDIKVVITDDDSLPLTVWYDDKFSTRLRFTEEQDAYVLEQASISFAKEPQILPGKNRVVLSGDLPLLPVDEWLEFLTGLEQSGESSFRLQEGMRLDLDLDRLYVVTNEDDNAESDEESTDDESRPHPDQAMLVNGEIRELRVDDMKLGKFEIKSARTENGIRFEKISFNAPHMNLNGRGSWFFNNDQHTTNMIFQLTSSDLGAMLIRLGYKAIFKHGTTTANFQLSWHDTPLRYRTEILNGTLGLVVENGKIKEVDTGAGKLIGLLSLIELPKRLFLQFDDVQGGLSFDSIQGQLEIVDGNMTTEDLQIVGSVAIINITGRTGLADRDFNHIIKVIPNVSGTMPLIGWLLSGVQFGTASALIDWVFGSEIDESAAVTYSITGSWDKPVITELKKPETVDNSDDETDDEHE